VKHDVFIWSMSTYVGYDYIHSLPDIAFSMDSLNSLNMSPNKIVGHRWYLCLSLLLLLIFSRIAFIFLSL